MKETRPQPKPAENQQLRPLERHPTPLGDAGLSRALLGDFLASGNRAILLAWAQAELNRQLAISGQEPPAGDDDLPF